MAGYTRQSIADIINGSEVTAPPLNAEFNQVAAAFAAASGHSHDGSTGNAPKIDLTTSVSGYLPAVHGGIGGKNNLVATSNPTTTNDAGEGYAPGSMWENTTTGRVYICVGNTTNAAVWRELVQVQTSNKIIPEVTNTVDLGDPATRFQDIWLSGGISAFGNASIGGTLNVTGTSTLANVTASAGAFTTVTTSGQATLNSADINGGTIDGTSIGGTTPTTGTFTTSTAVAFVGPLAGDVVGNVTGNLTGNVSGDLTGDVTSTGTSSFTAVNIDGGAIDGTTLGATTASTVTGTTITATTGFVGNIAGDVTGDVTGNLTGGVTGNVTATSGTSTFNDVTINGTLNMDAGTTGTITNLTDPTNAQDAATKAYVDSEVASLVDSAPGALDTLNELADALGDDPNFSTTITNSIATKLPLAGGTMSGNIAMGANTVTGLATPTSGTDAATKAYVDIVAGSASDAAASATLAENYATEDEDVEVEAGKYSAFHFSEKASASATAASASETNASTSEGNASTFATNASNSATAAAASATNSATSESNAATSASGAGTSATNAATSESNAATSATNSAISETNAATSEANAATSETNASTSEINAAASAATAEDAAIVFAIALG